MLEDRAKDWLINGGGGHEDGEDGLRALSVTGVGLIEYLAAYEEYVTASLLAENARLRSVCAEAYQLAGAYDAPVEALDNLSAAASGLPLPHETFLPVPKQ